MPFTSTNPNAPEQTAVCASITARIRVFDDALVRMNRDISSEALNDLAKSTHLNFASTSQLLFPFRLNVTNPSALMRIFCATGSTGDEELKEKVSLLFELFTTDTSKFKS
ncbi:hypothetical protein D3C86_1735490 [compost metagenome]